MTKHLREHLQNSKPLKKPLSREQFLELLPNNGRIFKVIFVKKSTGELRTMICRLGVKKHLKGGSKPFDDKKKNLLTVFDMQKRGYRSFDVSTVKFLQVNGRKVIIEQ